jgi:DNA-directed RNA polymerase II subunit RPB1
MITYSLKYGDSTEICEVEFEIMSTEEVRRTSVAEITEATLYSKGAPHMNGMLDVRMGTIDRRHSCATCGQDIRTCPGHFGHIELPFPMYHIGFLENTLKTLRSVCFFCSRLLLPIEELDLTADTGKPRFLTVYAQCKQRRKCCRCDGQQPNYSRLPSAIRADWSDVTFESEEERQFANAPLTARSVRSIFHCMDPADIAALGFTKTQPQDFILEVIVVPPPIARPAIHANEGSRAKSQDDLTLKLQDINKRCIETRAAMKGLMLEDTTMDAPLHIDLDLADKLNKLQLEVFSYMNSNVKAPKRQPNKSVAAIKSVGDRLKGKDGRVRGNLMGKRVDQSARSVIAPDACMDVDQVGVPQSIAISLTISERVSALNIERLTDRIRKGPRVVGGAESVLTKDGVLFQLEFCQALHNIRLEIGWIVERYLEENDYVIFNRQPSLHRMGMMAHRVKIVEGSTFRLNLCCANPYNADFDGDEMNMHVPQSSASLFEMMSIMAVPLQIISPASNKPVMAIVQDTLLAASLLTQEGVVLDRRHMMQLVGVLEYPNVPWHAMLPQPAVLAPVELWTGRQAFSLLLPPGFEYRRGNATDNGAVIIANGELIVGSLTKASLGTSTGSLIDRMFRASGSQTTNNFMSDTQRLCNLWLLWQGFNVSVTDCILSERGLTRVREKIDLAVQSIDRINTEVQRDEEWELVETTTRSILSKVLMTVGGIVEEELPHDNAIRAMVRAGSKGNALNLSQIMGCVGQQSVNGRRTCAGMRRTLSNFEEWSRDVESRGFVRNSYCKGLTVSEYYFHAMGGREGLVDTAVKTAETGYMQRRLIKGMEDNRVEYDGTVRNACGCLIQFAYGTDGFDPCKLERQSCVGLDWGRDVLLERFGAAGADPPAALTRQAGTARTLQRAVWTHRRLLRFEMSDMCVLPFNVRHVRWASVEHPASLDDLVDMVDAFIARLPKELITLQFSVLVHLRAVALRERHVGVEQLRDQLERLYLRCQTSAISPGEMVGSIAAQSVGEPCTQLTLNTFHAAGIGSQLTLGVPRFKELIDLSKNMRTPSMQVHLKAPFCTSRRFAEDLANTMIQTKLSDVVVDTAVVYSDATYPEDALATSIDMAMRPVPPDFTAEWIRMGMHRDLMLRRHLTPTDVKNHLMQCYGRTLHLTCADTNALEWFLHIRVQTAEGVSNASLLNQVGRQLLFDVQLAGMKKITNATVQTIADPVAPGETEERFIIETSGISMTHVALCDAVDMTRIMLNDIYEVWNTFGAEATVAKLFEQIETTISFDGTYVDPRHVLLIADTMLFEGCPMPLTRHGINRSRQNGPLARISFEETVDLINEAAMYNMSDTGRGVTQSVMTGQLARMGTGLVSVRMPRCPSSERLSSNRRFLCKSRIHYRNRGNAPVEGVELFRVQAGDAFRTRGPECERPFVTDRESEHQTKYAAPPRVPNESYVPPTPPRRGDSSPRGQ